MVCILDAVNLLLQNKVNYAVMIVAHSFTGAYNQPKVTLENINDLP